MSYHPLNTAYFRFPVSQKQRSTVTITSLRYKRERIQKVLQCNFSSKVLTNFWMAFVMEGTVVGGLEEELTCPICLELYQDPVFLPCQHNFCRECLNTHIQQHTLEGTPFPCPSCRCTVQLTEEHVTKLPKNFALANIISRLQSLKHGYTETETGTRCEKQGEICKAHSRSVSVFCNTCDTVLCTKCLRDHSGHHTLDLEDKVMSCKDEVKQSVLPKVTKLKNDLVSTQQDLIARRNRVEEEIENDSQEVLKAFSMLRLVLDRKESEMSSNLQTRKEDICTEFEREMQNIESHLRSVKQLESRMSTVLHPQPVSETYYYSNFDQYRELHKDTAQLECELNRASLTIPSNDSLQTVGLGSKRDICDTLRRMAGDLDKVELSDRKHTDNLLVLESGDQKSLAIHTDSKLTPDLIRKLNGSSHLTSKASDSMKPKTPDSKTNLKSDWMHSQAEDAEKSIPRNKPTVRCPDIPRNKPTVRCPDIPRNKPTVRCPDKKTQQGLMKKMLCKSFKKHSEVFIVSKSWIRKCQTFLSKKEGDGIHPGPVDNSSIMGTENNLIANLLEGEDFIAIKESCWLQIMGWYGLKDGQKPIVRKVILEGLLSGTLTVEIYPMKVVLECMGQRSYQCYSKSDTIGFLKQEFYRIFKLSDGKELQLKVNVGGSNKCLWMNLSNQANTSSLKDAGITQGTEIHCDFE
ncbi:E3 ubiquitin-protein ligase TRIM7-like [Pecten maximus]|uniref:E3 ubiquitin-protein ligase TRIM7-like n=1 Tax=Pecten maximus TaxID=6579 RepID=UPI001458E1D9|nr:E3 ubiquitin-protein ligase TRIM7-like [Pecten maximus]